MIPNRPLKKQRSQPRRVEDRVLTPLGLLIPIRIEAMMIAARVLKAEVALGSLAGHRMGVRW